VLAFGRHVTNYGLATIIDMNMLNSDKLGTAISQASQRFDLLGESSHQFCRCRRHHGYVTVATVASSDPAGDCHRCGMGAGHLDDQGAFYLVSGLCQISAFSGSMLANTQT
jgi:hypothetical protein